MGAADREAVRHPRMFLAITVVLLLVVAFLSFTVLTQGGSTSTVTRTVASSQLAPEASSVTLAETSATYQDDGPVRIGIQQGIFASLGLNVSLLTTLNLYAALISGQVGFAITQPPFAADEAGANLITVGVTGLSYPGVIIAKPGTESLSELNGSTWGCSSAGSLTCTMPYLLIKSQGWTYSPALIKPIGHLNSVVAAFENGEIQAFIYNYGEALKLQAAGKATLLGDMRTYVPNWYPGAVLTSSSYANKNPNTVRLFLAGLYTSIAWIANHPNATISWMEGQYQMSRTEATAVFNSTQFSLTGRLDPTVYQQMYEVDLSQAGLQPLDWQSTYTLEYLPTLTYSP